MFMQIPINFFRKILKIFRAKSNPSSNGEQLNEIKHLSKTTARFADYDSKLLERVQLFWRLGEWESIVIHDIGEIQLNPDRAKIALLISSAHLQLGDIEKGKIFLQFCRDNGCADELIAEVLAIGIHNSLSNAAMAVGDDVLMRKHLNLAIGTDFMNEERLILFNLRSLSERIRRDKKQFKLPTSSLDIDTSQ